MGEVRVTIRVGHPLTPQQTEPCEVLADTGATLTMLPASLLTRLGIQPEREATFVLADRRELRQQIGEAQVTLEGVTITASIVFGAEDDAPLLGLTVLEEVGLAVDPTNRRLVPSKYLLY